MVINSQADNLIKDTFNKNILPAPESDFLMSQLFKYIKV